MENNKYECNHWVTNFKSVDLMIYDSIREIWCIKCSSLVGWWDIPTKKIIPIRRTWTKEERLAMR
jgi:hypothetical protein